MRKKFKFLIFLFTICYVDIISIYAIEKPPCPNTKKKIDYVEWYKDQVNCNVCTNCIDAYSLFPQDPNGEILNYIKPDKSEDVFIRSLIAKPRIWDQNEFPNWPSYLAKIDRYKNIYIDVEGKQYCLNFPENTKHLFEIELPHLRFSRLISRAMMVSAWKRTKNEIDPNNFTEIVTKNLSHAFYIQQGVLAEYLSAIAIRDMTYTSLLVALQKNLLGEKSIVELKEFLENNDFDNILKDYAKKIYFELAGQFDILQAMTKYTFLGPKFNKRSVEYWLNLCGYFSTFGGLQKPGFPSKILSENPMDIGQRLEGYYTECHDLVRNGFDPNYNLTFEKLKREYSSDFTYFTVIPLMDIAKPYEMLYQLERKRRLTHIAINFLHYFYANAAFPETLNNLEIADLSILIDPITQKQFQISIGKGEVWLNGPEYGDFKKIEVCLRTPKR